MIETYYLNGRAYTFETQEELDAWLLENPGASTVDNSVAAQDATFVNPAVIPDQIGNLVSDEPINIEMSEQEQLEFDTNRENMLHKDAKDTLSKLTSEQGKLNHEFSDFGERLVKAEKEARSSADILSNEEAKFDEKNEDILGLFQESYNPIGLHVDG